MAEFLAELDAEDLSKMTTLVETKSQADTSAESYADSEIENEADAEVDTKAEVSADEDEETELAQLMDDFDYDLALY